MKMDGIAGTVRFETNGVHRVHERFLLGNGLHMSKVKNT